MLLNSAPPPTPTSCLVSTSNLTSVLQTALCSVNVTSMAELSSPNFTPAVKRKRPRAARACEACRTKKYRCDEQAPCSRCKKQNVSCVYEVADAVRQRLLQSDRPQASTRVASSQPRGSPSPLHMSRFTGDPSATNNALDGQMGTAAVSRKGDEDIDEVSDVNPHTQNPEFHGKTSSMAFLASLQTRPSSDHGQLNSTSPSDPSHPSIVSILHNEGFSPGTLGAHRGDSKLLEYERYYFRQAHTFLEGYFQNLHFIHPILDRARFMSRCEDLWFGRPEKQPSGFVALYYSLMSLGALTRTWNEPHIDGMGRLVWSRRLFDLARIALETLKNEISIDSVQCLFFMAKVSQNELNPSLAYLYLGWATRACFSAGFNRKNSHGHRTLQEDESAAKLFWGLYSLEIETSFALGRPDGLGSDAYHNQPMPAVEGGETSIITLMVHFSRIVKEVSESIYLSEIPWAEKAEKANEIEMEMDSWLQKLPNSVKPSLSKIHDLPKIAKDPLWAQRQRVVLGLRFHNVKMVLFRPFLAAALRSKQNLSQQVDEATGKCVAAAKSTIELMHEMYLNHTFFRTWWYNTTYILYAVSIVLCYATRLASIDDVDQYLELGERTIDILETMEESLVATKSAEVVRHFIFSARRSPENMKHDRFNIDFTANLPTESKATEMDVFFGDNMASFLDFGMNLDFVNMPSFVDAESMLSWNETTTAYEG